VALAARAISALAALQAASDLTVGADSVQLYDLVTDALRAAAHAAQAATVAAKVAITVAEVLEKPYETANIAPIVSTAPRDSNTYLRSAHSLAPAAAFQDLEQDLPDEHESMLRDH